MKKYESMILSKQEQSHTKVEIALETMKKMFDKGEQVLVCTLVKQTGLSRAFYYNNETVHSELVRLQKLQEGKDFVTPKKVIFDKAMAKENDLLKMQLREKDELIAQLQSKIKKLENKAKSHVVSVLNDL